VTKKRQPDVKEKPRDRREGNYADKQQKGLICAKSKSANIAIQDAVRGPNGEGQNSTYESRKNKEIAKRTPCAKKKKEGFKLHKT